MPINPDNYVASRFAPICPAFRCRPDESQIWRRLEIGVSVASELRTRAVENGVTVDAWLNVALAGGLTGTKLSRDLKVGLFKLPVRRSSNRRIEAWQRYLEEQDRPGLDDELPEVVLSQAALEIESKDSVDIPRLLALTDSDWEFARDCEIRAAGLGVGGPALLASLDPLAAA
jgi:hypothetical protein